METLEQKRAQHAWKKSQEGVARVGKDYINVAKGFPSLIMNSGLLQVMAFAHEKGKVNEMVAEHLRDWLSFQCKTPKEFAQFMEALMKFEPQAYQAITTEAFAWLKWLRQIAPAVEGRN
jgi:CRISPR-associated protein Cmr5